MISLPALLFNSPALMTFVGLSTPALLSNAHARKFGAFGPRDEEMAFAILVQLRETERLSFTNIKRMRHLLPNVRSWGWKLAKVVWLVA